MLHTGRVLSNSRPEANTKQTRFKRLHFLTSHGTGQGDVRGPSSDSVALPRRWERETRMSLLLKSQRGLTKKGRTYGEQSQLVGLVPS
jgi:hypothetical protein